MSPPNVAAALLAGTLSLLTPTATAAADDAPDLEASFSVLFTPLGGGAIRAGRALTYSSAVHNRGTAVSAATTVRFYLSTDNTFTGADTEIATMALSSIEPDGAAGVDLDLRIPDDTESGTYYIGYCVDVVPGETNTANNCAQGIVMEVQAREGRRHSPRETPTASLEAAPNPVAEGSSVTVTARLSAALSGDVDIPVTLTRHSSEAGDHGTLSAITIGSGSTSGAGTITTAQDADTDDETFTVALGSLPSSVLAGTPSSVRVTIRDDDGGGGGGGQPENAAPSFGAASYAFELREGVPGRVEVGRVAATDPEGGAVSYTLAEGGGSRFEVGPGTGAVTYTGPGEDYEAEPNRYELAVAARDPHGAEARARVAVTVANVNEEPEAAADEAEVDEDGEVDVDVLANDRDPDGDALRVESVTAPAHGTARVPVGGEGVVYAPEPDWHGVERFTYTVSDGNGATAEATVEVTVESVNDAPVAAPDTVRTAEDMDALVAVLANDTDVDGDALRVESVTAPAHGTAWIAVGGGEVVYAPEPDWHGVDRFTYTVSDGNGATAEATVEVTVDDVEPVPTTLAKVGGDSQQGPSGTPLAEPLMVSLLDQGGTPHAGETVTFAVTAGGGTLSVTRVATDAQGRASSALTLGRTPGANAVRVTAAGLAPVTFTAIGVVIPRTLAKHSGDGQAAGPGAQLAEPLVVSVLDQNGSAFPGAVVTFAVLGDGGILTAVSDTTDAEGLAATALTLGGEFGTYTVVATAADIEPVTFTATAKANPDFDEDGEVGFSDFFLLAHAFGGSDPRFDLDASGTVDFADFFLFAEHFGQPARAKLMALARERIGLPAGPQLRQNAPNPFNSGTALSWFQLRSGPARLEVFALNGQRVAILHEGPRKAGLHRLRWDGRDDRGRPLASGVYVYRLVTAEAVQTRKLTLLR